MTTPEFSAEIALDILADLAAEGTDPRGADGRGAAWTVGQHGTAQQQSRLHRIEAAAQRKHGAAPGLKLSNITNGSDQARGMDAADRAIAKALGI